ncbi:MAG: Phosphatidate cytidylyltransferase [Parcubacteria group bacterium GW2011_GWC2_44_22]|nr:MAG: Phosphatidate cytidylyltransferase [Parcubacteria group bacterium GW2011_GWC2_44_22]
MSREILRKILHLLGYWNLIAFIVLAEFVGERVAFLVLTLILLLFLELEYLRVEHGIHYLPFKFNIFREKEQSTFAAHIYMTLAAIVCFAAFNRVIAAAAFSMTILGDAFSALVGRRWGKHKFIFSNKTWEGTLAGFGGNLLAGYFFINHLEHAWLILLPMAAVASLVEVFTQKLDDNLTVAIFAGVCGQLLLFVL